MKSVVIFKTNVTEQNQAETIIHTLKTIFPELSINFDLEDRDNVLRTEASVIDIDMVVKTVENLGFKCKVIPDKICDDNKRNINNIESPWETIFIQNEAVWGLKAANAAVLAKEIFIQNKVRKVLVPGIGYGRNAQVFIENNMQVTGIEISQTAIDLAATYYDKRMQIFHGSVTDMPFDTNLYDGIFCYGLLYLLNGKQRSKMIHDCYNQLEPGGTMIFSVVSKNSVNYGKGKIVGKDSFEVATGVELFFYDSETVKKDFQNYGLEDFFEIDEAANISGTTSFRFIFIVCKKN